MPDSPPPSRASRWALGSGRSLSLDRPRILGILNVTPDSFSDGGRHLDRDRAIDHAKAMIEAGADAVDVGGESTRPGADPVPASEQIERTRAVVAAIVERFYAIVSIDTTSAAVARAALDAGAAIVNDQSAGRDDPDMLPLVAERGAGIVLMHRLRPPTADSYSDRYREAPRYDDVAADVEAFLRERARAAEAAGVAAESIAIDPGLGFGKSVEQNFRLIAETGRFAATGHPVVAASSRKSFLGRVAGVEDPAARDRATIAATVAQVLAGARVARVHDVAGHREALAVAAAVLGALDAGEPRATMDRPPACFAKRSR